MLIESLVGFLGASILFYCIFAGADFGAGILEFFLSREKHKEQRALITHAMGPVWEANHVWLILAVVILFNGFPKAYSAFSIKFHIPLTLALIGVIMRGCSFTFRHYDAIQDRSRYYYSLFFKISSVLTPLMFGMIAGASLLGRTPTLDPSFAEIYVSPWLNLFSFSVGLFTCVLFAFLAAVYLVGETKNDIPLRDIFSQRAKALNIIAVLTGGLVFSCAYVDGLPLIGRFADEPVSVASMALATLLLIPLWLALTHGRTFVARGCVVLMVASILIGWFGLQFPVILASENTFKVLTFFNSAAPDSVLKPLLYALVIGSGLIFPALIYLLKIFKWDEPIH